MGEEPIEAAEFLLADLTERSEVSYAEVGAVSRRQSDIVVTHRRTRNANQIDESGVWCRVFTDGAVGYRYSTVLAEDNLRDIADKVVREGKYLGQDEPDRFDQTSLHRGIHLGWANDRFDNTPIDEEVQSVETARTVVSEQLELERARFGYQSECLDEMIMTTTGNTLQTGIDRASLELTIVPTGGRRIQRHIGTTAGPAILDELPSFAEAAASDGARTVTQEETSVLPAEQMSVVLGPKAAGQLIQRLTGFLEMDTVYLGASPFEMGAHVAASGLTIHDTVKPGSWAARAYDAECRPTTPTTLVDEGRVARYLHSTTTAALEDTLPAGNTLQPLDYEHPPRIHPRHLSVEPGSASSDGILEGASLHITQFDRNRLANMTHRTRRASDFPPSPLYAKNIANQAPADATEERTQLSLPLAEGYVIENGDLVGIVDDADVEFAINDLQSIDAMTAARETVTGVSTKFRARFPYAVTTPAIRLRTRVVG